MRARARAAYLLELDDAVALVDLADLEAILMAKNPPLPLPQSIAALRAQGSMLARGLWR